MLGRGRVLDNAGIGSYNDTIRVVNTYPGTRHLESYFRKNVFPHRVRVAISNSRARLADTAFCFCSCKYSKTATLHS